MEGQNMNSTSRMVGFATFLVIATATSVYAQQPQAIRGTIDKIDGGIVSIKQAKNKQPQPYAAAGRRRY
jgi:hypothetical protein